MGMSIKFNNSELVNNVYNPRVILDNSTPTKDIDLMKITKKDGLVVVNDLFNEKVIEMRGIIVASGMAHLQNLIDDTNKMFSIKDANLDITPDGGNTRRYVVRLNEPIVYDRDFYHINSVPYSVRFLVPAGFGKATSESHPVDTNGITSARSPASGSSQFTLVGSAPPKPRFVFKVNTLGQLAVIELTDDNSGDYIKIDGPFTASDEIEINVENMLVTNNNVVIPFRGKIPEFQLGVNNYHIDLHGADYTLDQSQTDNYGTGSVVGNNGAGITRSLAQSFIPSESGYVKKISLWAKKTGTPTNGLYVQIKADNGGKPGANVGTSFVAAAADVSTDAAGANVDIIHSGTPPFLTAGVRYWLFIYTVNDSGKYYTIFGGAQNYSDGWCMKNETTDGSGTWEDYTATIADLYFRVYRGKGSAADWNVDFDAYYTQLFL
jgi:hypothetical protein